MRQLLQSFDRIYVINLRTRADRRMEMDAQLRNTGLSLHDASVQLFEAVRPNEAAGFPSIGARGCFMSHLGVLKDARRRGLSSLLILEDDVDFDPAAQPAGILQGLQREDWSLFYGGHRIDAIAGPGPCCAAVPPEAAVLTTHFVGVRGRDTISALIAYMEAQLQRSRGDPAGGPMHVDGTYSWFRREHPERLTLAAVPPLAYQRASRSDIAAVRTIDRVWGLRFVVRHLRGCRNLLRQKIQDSTSATTSNASHAMQMLRYARLRIFHALLRPVSAWARRRRMALFMKVMDPAPGLRILDLGGQPQIWDHVQPRLDITCVNLPGVATTNHESRHLIRYVEADACRLPDDLASARFDMVFSNSVIEHVGDEDRRRAFAGEVLRMSDRYWIQTPSRWFPLEAHCGMPFWWFYPASLRAYLLRRWQAKLPAWTDMVANTDVVGTAELRSILPGCHIRHERLLGIPKSIVAYSVGASCGDAPRP